MDLEKAKQIAITLANELTCPIKSIDYIGLIDGLFVFHIIRENHGKHIGLPLYISVSKTGLAEWIDDGDTLYKAMTKDFLF